ncbi:MAG: response regulator transcription factor [Acidobacteria bacterium]|nr:response regulator transcription factor [Acidobacteriota bacterium]
MDWETDMNAHTVFVCDAEPAAVAGVQGYLESAGGFEWLGSANSVSAASARLEEARPAVLLLDHASGLRNTIQFLSELRFLSAKTHCVLWIRDLPESEQVRAFQSGMKGIVRRVAPLAVLADALRQVANGETFLEESASPSLRQWATRRNVPRLTPREREIIGLVSHGLKNREIAERLAITPGTVKVHLMHVFEKTGARDRYELAVHGDRLLEPIESGTGVLQSA